MSLDGFVAGPSQSVESPLGNLVPTLLGSGERLFDGVGDNLHGLDLLRTIAAPQVTHLKFVRR